MAKQNLNIGSAANDGTGDSLRDGAIKLNSVINEIYTNLGNDTNLLVNINQPVAGQVLRWNGSVFAEGHFDSLSADLNVKGFKITSESNGDVVIQPHGTGDIKFWAGGTGSAYTYIDGADGKLKYTNHFNALGDLPNATIHHGMFAHVHDEGHGYVAHSGAWMQLIDEGSSIGELADVNMTIGGGPSDGQVLKWNATGQYWYAANDATGSGGTTETQNIWQSIFADSGQTTASAPTDVLTIAGGTNIATSITGDTLTINMTGQLGDPDQNIFSTIGSDSGSKTANSTATTINIIGGTGISTSINGDNLIVTNTEPNIVQEVFKTVAGDTGNTTAQLSTSTLTVAGGNGIDTAATTNTLTVTAQFWTSGTIAENKTIIFGSNGQSVITDSPTLGWNISGTTGSGYAFTGPGVSNSTWNPTIYVYRGFTYRFNNLSAGAHPFALRQTAGGAAVTDGVSGAQDGVQFWTVPMTVAAGTTYVYQCTIHPGMVGNLVVV
jgi:hypothetical protein